MQKSRCRRPPFWRKIRSSAPYGTVQIFWCGNAARRQLVGHHLGGGAVEIGERVFLVLALEIGGVVRQEIEHPQAGALVFRLEDAHQVAHRPGGVIEHPAHAAPRRAAKGPERLPRHGVDEIARLQVAPDPLVEAVVLPAKERPRVRAERGGHMLEQAVDDGGAHAVGADLDQVAVGQFPLRVARVVDSERAQLRQLHRDRIEMTRIGRGNGNLQDGGRYTNSPRRQQPSFFSRPRGTAPAFGSRTHVQFRLSSSRRLRPHVVRNPGSAQRGQRRQHADGARPDGPLHPAKIDRQGGARQSQGGRHRPRPLHPAARDDGRRRPAARLRASPRSSSRPTRRNRRASAASSARSAPSCRRARAFTIPSSSIRRSSRASTRR